MDAGQINYVGLLNECAQKKGWRVKFDLVQTAGPDHSKSFTMRVVMNGENYPEGVGRNKKEAKQTAAKNALDLLDNDESVNAETNLHSTTSFSSVTKANFICWLNEYSHKKRLYFTAKETTKMSAGSNIQICSYACKYVCGDKEFPEATANSKKEAKEAAAKLVHEIITEQEQEKVHEENGNWEENPNIQNHSLHHLKLSTLTDTENTTAEKNFKGLLNEYCQKTNQVPDFKAVDRRGPAHVPEFLYKVIIRNKEYPEGRGRTAKEAQQKAAQLALRELTGFDSSSQVSSPSSTSCSTYDASSSPMDSKTPSKSESIVFADTPSVPEAHLHVKPKRQLAPTFPNSPKLNIPKPSGQSPAVSSPPIESRFLEEFQRDSIERIGKGGYGRVFKARRKLEDTVFAVKIVKFTRKALREVKGLSCLEHANIVRYHTAWVENTGYRNETPDTFSNSSSESGSQYLYIQMEFCNGDTLRKWIDKRNDHPEKYSERRWEAAEIIKQVLEAVNYIHSQSLFHRDLKPENIMFGPKGVVKVGDFGLVTTEEGDDDGNLLDRTSNAGTHSYMSPEQERHRKDYDKTVDIYAVGLIYFELLWRFGTWSERKKEWKKIRSKNFPEEFSKWFDFEHKLIDKMLCENPENRPEASILLTGLGRHSATTASTEHSVHRENKTY